MNLVRPLLAASAVIALVLLLGPWWSYYEFDADEGLNLQKAVLVAQGYGLYREIWSDQPPVLTYVLAGVHLVFPFSIVAARAMILLFAGLLAACLFRVVARFDGNAAGWGSVFLLATSSLYLERSISVMIGLPAIALAMLSIDLAMPGRPRPGRCRVAAAGVAFALALLTKMFVLLVLPALLAGLWLTAWERGRAGWLRAAWTTAWFLAPAAVTIGVTFLVVKGFSFDQLFGTHIAARSSKAFGAFGGFGQLFEIVMKHASSAALFAAIFGLAAFWKRPAGVLLVPITWLAVGLLALGTHQPLWGHQVLIVVPPMCWLGGVGFKSLFVRGERLRIVDIVADHPDRRVKVAGWTLVFAALMPVTAIVVRDNVRHVHRVLHVPPAVDEQVANTTLALFGATSDVLITDKPIDAYYHRKAVPPNLAVWSGKRAWTGRITDEDILHEVRTRPESQVLLRRHAHSAALLDRIAEITPRVISATGRYSTPSNAFFARLPVASSLERKLMLHLPDVAAESLGGVTDPQHGWRLDRQMSTAALPEKSVVARPPGSAQELGACLVVASRVSRSGRLLLEALGVARALACVQSASGGWKIATSHAGQCMGRLNDTAKSNETLDDGTVPSILHFLFDLSDRLSELSIEQPRWLAETIESALDFSLASQRVDGSWPQMTSDDDGLHRLATLNDDAMSGMIRVLLAAYARNGSPTLLDAARRGGDFLLRAQAASGKAAFAQQYNPSLEPARGRKFEPAAHASLETAYAINALIDLHLATGDESYLTAARAAADWLTRSEITPGVWARLYEIGTSKPIYANRSGVVTYRLSDLPLSEIRSYRWMGGRDVFPEIGIALDRLERLRDGLPSLQVYDESVAAASLLAATPTARLPLVPHTGKITPDTVQSTRAFAEYCAGLIATERANLDKAAAAVDD